MEMEYWSTGVLGVNSIIPSITITPANPALSRMLQRFELLERFERLEQLDYESGSDLAISSR
jgi:hypothetical protein